MNRLDLLKQKRHNSPRSETTTQDTKNIIKTSKEDYKNINNDIETLSDNNINIIEIDLDDSLIDKDLDNPIDIPKIKNVIPNEIIPKKNNLQDISYTDNDIKMELSYVYETREDISHSYIKTIIGGGLEIAIDKVLELDDIVKITVEIVEHKEKITCEGAVISVFPKNNRSTNDTNNPYRYILQLIGKNAPEMQIVIHDYLLGYKIT